MFKNKMVEQRFLGLLSLLVGVVVLLMAVTAATFEDSDATAALFFIPVGLVLLFSPKVFID